MPPWTRRGVYRPPKKIRRFASRTNATTELTRALRLVRGAHSSRRRQALIDVVEALNPHIERNDLEGRTVRDALAEVAAEFDIEGRDAILARLHVASSAQVQFATEEGAAYADTLYRQHLQDLREELADTLIPGRRKVPRKKRDPAIYDEADVWLHRVMRDAELPATATKVAAVLSVHERCGPRTPEKNGSTKKWPTLDAIAAAAGMGRRNVITLLQALETRGHLEISRGGGRGQTSSYRLMVDGQVVHRAFLSDRVGQLTQVVG